MDAFNAGQRSAQHIARGINATVSSTKGVALSAKSFVAGFKAGWQLGALRPAPAAQQHQLVVITK